MTALLFLWALASAAIAWNLDHPNHRATVPMVLSFAFGLLFSELAFHLVAAQCLALLLLLAGHDLEGGFDYLLLAVLLGSWVVVLRHYLLGSGAAERMELALRSGLGSDYRAAIAPAQADKFPLAVPLRPLLRPFDFQREEVRRLRDIPFTEADGLRICLDVYHHRDKPQHAPVLLQIHGGGWTEKMGSKNEQGRPLMAHMAARGWVCVAVDYRLSPHSTFPAHIIDCKRGLAWIREHVAEYGGNPDFVCVTGGSAGGHLCALLALSANDPDFQPGFESVDTTVQAAVPFYGVYDLADELGLHLNKLLVDALEDYIVKASRDEAPELFAQGSPIQRVHPDAPPFLVIHGDRDSLCAVAEARAFVDRLRASSEQSVCYAEIAGAQHAFELFHSLRSMLVIHGVERYLAHCYSAWQAQQQLEQGT